MQVEFHFDFGSPNAYLCHKVIPQLEKKLDINVKYVPILLGGLFKLTNNMSPMQSLAGIQNKPQYQQITTQRFCRDHDIDNYKMNPHFPINTLPLMRGAIAAEKLGCASEFIELMYHHMWEQPKNMGNPEVLTQVLATSSLDGKAIFEQMTNPEVKKALIDNTQASADKGCFGSPTFFVGDEIFFGKDSLHDLATEISLLRKN